jgi:mannose-6-phosphate isomerase-like protein (cupin superfamily)
MKVVKINVTGDFIGEKYLRESPLKTDKVLFNVYNFQPWQTLGTHKHPSNDEIFFVVEGRCNFYMEDESRTLEENMAIYVPSNHTHAIMSLDRDAVLISVIGPQPVESIYTRGQDYQCPVCGLDTPTIANIEAQNTITCPRCNARLRLEKAGHFIEAIEVPGEAPPGAEAR